MARLRYINPDVWENRELRKLGWVARNVFLYCFSKAADDEGRFKADPFAILEGAFSRQDPVTEDDVAEALHQLNSDDAGMLVLYGDRQQYGFVANWYAHQSMPARLRSESALPAPPVRIESWESADRVRTEYARFHEVAGANVSYRDAVRWFCRENAASVAQYEPSSDPVRTESELSTTRREVEGERKGEEKEGSTDSPPDGGGVDENGDRTDEQRCIRKCFETLTGEPLPKEFPKGRPYSTAATIVSDCGIDDCEYWLSQQTCGEVPEGANSWRWFCQQFKGVRHVKAPWEWRQQAEKRRREGLAEQRNQIDDALIARQREEQERRDAWQAACKEFPGGFTQWKVLKATEPERLDQLTEEHRTTSIADSYRALLGALAIEMTSTLARRTTSQPSQS